MLGFNLFFQNLKLPLLLSLLFLLIKYMHQLALLSLLTQQIEKVFVFPLLPHFLLHHIRPVIELLQFLVPFYLPVLWIGMLII